jgi:hypothetical protein
MWQLWLFGIACVPVGFWLWHRQGWHFGLGAAKGHVDAGVAYSALAACLAFLFLGIIVDGE